MKKVFLALGIFAFILTGAVAVETASFNDTDNVVYDDPPKADKKKSKSTADYSKGSCCSSKTASMSKSDCSDEKSTSTAKAKSTSTKTTTAANTTKKSSPDKK